MGLIDWVAYLLPALRWQFHWTGPGKRTEPTAEERDSFAQALPVPDPHDSPERTPAPMARVSMAIAAPPPAGPHPDTQPVRDEVAKRVLRSEEFSAVTLERVLPALVSQNLKPRVSLALRRYEPQVLADVVGTELMYALQIVSAKPDHVELRQRVGGHLICALTLPPKLDVEGGAQRVGTWRPYRMPLLRAIGAQEAAPVPFLLEASGISTQGMARTMQLIDVSWVALNSAIARFKHTLAVERPIVYAPNLQPCLATPTHLATPAGHAALAFFVLGLLAPWAPKERRQRLEETAQGISLLREVAGLHYDFDGVAGECLGRSLASWMHAAANGSEDWIACSYTVDSGDRKFGVSGRGATRLKDWQWLYAAAAAEWVGGSSAPKPD